MKKVRLFLVGALMSTFIVVGAGPASANCITDPAVPDVCATVCQTIKVTRPFCMIG